MIKIEAVLQPSKLDAVKDALLEAGVEGMTILEAAAMAVRRPHRVYRGREYTVDLLPKVKIELVVKTSRRRRPSRPSSRRPHRPHRRRQNLRQPVADAIRIRNDERGETAL